MRTLPRLTAALVASAALLLSACGSDEPPQPSDEPSADATDAAATEVADDPLPDEPAEPAAPADDPPPPEVEGTVAVDGEEVPLWQSSCGNVGGGSTWRVAAAFDIEPQGRFYFDVRARLTEDGEPDWESTPTGPDVTLQWIDPDDEEPDAFAFLTADRRIRGGDTTALDISFAGASGEIEVQRQVVRQGELEREDEIDGELRTVTFDLTCP